MLSQILVNSILSALLLSLVAIGFNLIFNATKVFHLAHGAMYVSAVYSVYHINNYLHQFLPPAVTFTVSLFLSLMFISVLIVLIEYLVYRPLYRNNVNPTISLISSLGVYLLVTNLITLFFGNESISLDYDYHIIISNNYFKITTIELINVIISLTLLIAVILISKTTIYRDIRALTYSYAVSEKFGINVQYTRVIALITGTLLVGIAGIMRGYEIAIEPNVGLTIVLTASVAVIVGGVNSLTGTIIACFIISLIDNYSVKFLSAQWKDVLTYTLLIGILIINQQGLVSVKQRVETR